MSKQLKTCGIDVGGINGIYMEGEICKEFKIANISDYYNFIYTTLNRLHPDVVVSCRPTRMYNVIVSQTKKLAIIELVCEQLSIKHDLRNIDSSCKKVVLGNGRASKEDIIAWAKEDSEHVSDAKMFTEYYKIKNNLTN